MPTFYFDCFDGERHQVDRHGIELAEGDVSQQAGVLAQSLLVEGSPDAEGRSATVTVRAQDGVAVYVAHCSLTGGWTRDRDPVATAPDQG